MESSQLPVRRRDALRAQVCSVLMALILYPLFSILLAILFSPNLLIAESSRRYFYSNVFFPGIFAIQIILFLVILVPSLLRSWIIGRVHEDINIGSMVLTTAVATCCQLACLVLCSAVLAPEVVSVRELDQLFRFLSALAPGLVIANCLRVWNLARLKRRLKWTVSSLGIAFIVLVYYILGHLEPDEKGLLSFISRMFCLLALVTFASAVAGDAVYTRQTGREKNAPGVA